MRDLALRAPPTLAIAEGATAPDPGFDGAVAWSSTTGRQMVWNDTTNAWHSYTPVHVGSSAPSNPGAGDLWVDTTAPVLTVTPSANQDNYNPTGLAGADVLRLNIGATLKLTGLVAAYDGQRLTLQNVSTDYLLWLESENTASSAANRILLPKGLPAFLMPGDSIGLRYDGTASRWRVEAWPSQGPAMGLTEFSDFAAAGTPANNGATGGGFGVAFSGTGASAQPSTYLVGTTERPMGVLQIDSGTTATGRCTVGGLGTGDIVPTLGAALSVARLAVEATVSGTETFQVISGFADCSGGTFTDGVAWTNRWTGSAADWAQERLANGSATRSSTGSPTPDNNYIGLAVFINPGWTRADFLYSTDGISWTKADSPTTGLPANTRFTTWCAASIIKSAGTTQRNVSIDYAGYRVDQVRA